MALMILMLAGNFSGARDQVTETSAAPALSDVSFTAKVDGTEQRYVLMLPAGFEARQPHSLLVALHGHGSDRWQFAKDPRDECRAARDFATKHSFIYVSPDYRAKTSWMGLKAEADLLQILDELSERFHLDKVLVCGGSMGGTAALTFAALHPDRVQGVVALNGTANLVEFTGFPEAIAASYGGTKAERPDEYRKRSAEFWPERFTMPLALTAGGRDTVVPPDSLLRLTEKLKQQGRRVLLLLRPELGHSTSYADALAALDFVFDEWSRPVPDAGKLFPPEMRLEPLPALAPEPKDNPTTAAKVALGRLLFFDPILSAAQDVSCASCHHPRFGWADGRATPIGVGGTGLGPERILRAANGFPPLTRNTPTLLNVGFNGLVAGCKYDPAVAPMFWDSRVESLERQAVTPIRSREEMRGNVCSEAVAVEQAVRRVDGVAEYRNLFNKAFGQLPAEAVTAAHLAQALAAFERSLVTPDAPFDRFLRGDKQAMNEVQQRGLQVFQDAGCIQCHGGPMLSDYKLHFLAVSDDSAIGRREFRTPTLRNLKPTAPYMHDGSLRTLRSVLVFYEALMDAVSETLDGRAGGTPALDPLLKRLNLNADDFPALEAFLDALNDDHFDQTTPDRVPSGLPLLK